MYYVKFIWKGISYNVKDEVGAKLQSSSGTTWWLYISAFLEDQNKATGNYKPRQ